LIRLVTFDLYNTLCHVTPSRAQRLADACRDMGHDCGPDDFVLADVAAEEYYTVENGRWPLHTRTADERAAFYREAMRIRLRGAGLPHEDDSCERLRLGMEARRGRWELSDDVLPTFAGLRERGLAIAVISNTPVDATILCTELGVCDLVDFVVSSCLVGCEKPCPEIFEAALRRAGIAAAEAVHVGDQPRSDCLGAIGVGMHALLLDRFGHMAGETEYERISSLAAIVPWLDAKEPRSRGRSAAPGTRSS
jgi:HAD superfamily hydrolase (TIGR01549 family)